MVWGTLVGFEGYWYRESEKSEKGEKSGKDS
jgi:hypothetical protein